MFGIAGGKTIPDGECMNVVFNTFAMCQSFFVFLFSLLFVPLRAYCKLADYVCTPCKLYSIAFYVACIAMCGVSCAHFRVCA